MGGSPPSKVCKVFDSWTLALDFQWAGQCAVLAVLAGRAMGVLSECGLSSPYGMTNKRRGNAKKRNTGVPPLRYRSGRDDGYFDLTTETV